MYTRLVLVARKRYEEENTKERRIDRKKGTSYIYGKKRKRERKNVRR